MVRTLWTPLRPDVEVDQKLYSGLILSIMETSTEINISDSYSFGNVSYAAETFDTPFTSTHTRRLFITAYVIVFATCITGR